MKIINVVFTGDASTGKTSLINKYANIQNPSNTSPTIGSENQKFKISTNEGEVELNICDTAGSEKYSSIMPIYLRGGNVFFIVFDLTNKESFQSIEKWNDLIEEHADSIHKKVIIGNKSDLENQVVTQEEIEEMSRKIGAASSFVTSAVNGDNINIAFEFALTFDIPLNDTMPNIIKANDMVLREKEESCC